MAQKKWIGEIPKTCQICGEPLEYLFVDGVTLPTGQWAIMDVFCHSMYGAGIGEGLGQMYDNITGKKLEG